MVQNLLSAGSISITAGERDQLQRFRQTYGTPDLGGTNSVNTTTAIAVQTSLKIEVQTSYFANVQQTTAASTWLNIVEDYRSGQGPANAAIRESAYGKYLDSVFNPEGRTTSERDGRQVSLTHDEWREDVQVRLSDIAERISKLTSGETKDSLSAVVESFKDV